MTNEPNLNPNPDPDLEPDLELDWARIQLNELFNTLEQRLGEGVFDLKLIELVEDLAGAARAQANGPELLAQVQQLALQPENLEDLALTRHWSVADQEPLANYLRQLRQQASSLELDGLRAIALRLNQSATEYDREQLQQLAGATHLENPGQADLIERLTRRAASGEPLRQLRRFLAEPETRRRRREQQTAAESAAADRQLAGLFQAEVEHSRPAGGRPNDLEYLSGWLEQLAESAPPNQPSNPAGFRNPEL